MLGLVLNELESIFNMFGETYHRFNKRLIMNANKASEL